MGVPPLLLAKFVRHAISRRSRTLPVDWLLCTHSMSAPTLSKGRTHLAKVSAAQRTNKSQTVVNDIELIQGSAVAGPKRMRSPLQQQSGDNSPGYRHEIAMQQQLLKQQHGGSNSAMGSGGLFGGLGQHSTDGSQVQMHSQTAGLHAAHTLLIANYTACLAWSHPRPPPDPLFALDLVLW